MTKQDIPVFKQKIIIWTVSQDAIADMHFQYHLSLKENILLLLKMHQNYIHSLFKLNRAKIC